MISVADPPTTEKPPEYDTVCIVDPPCYDDAIKLNPANLLQTKYYQDVSLPNYDDLEINESHTCSSNQHPNNSQQSDSVTSTTTAISPNNNNPNEQNVTNSCSSNNAFTVITIVQSASNSSPSNERSITEKSTDCDSIASESITMS